MTPVATDQETGLMRGVSITTAHVHDMTETDAILFKAPGPTYEESLYLSTIVAFLVCKTDQISLARPAESI